MESITCSMSFERKITLIGPKDDSFASLHSATVFTNAACLLR